MEVDPLVVDNGSRDGTAEIASRHGARVVQKEWLGFGLQKQFAVDQAKNDWVLCMDADERVSPALERMASIPGATAGRRRGEGDTRQGATAGSDDDAMCDVLTPGEFTTEVTELLIRHAPSLTGAQLSQIRERLVEQARSHGWVEG